MCKRGFNDRRRPIAHDEILIATPRPRRARTNFGQPLLHNQVAELAPYGIETAKPRDTATNAFASHKYGTGRV